jgi:hypothetical protein
VSCPNYLGEILEWIGWAIATWSLAGWVFAIWTMANLAPRAFTNHFRDDRIEMQRYGFKLTGAAVGEGDIDVKRAYEIIKTRSTMRRINIETEMEIPLDSMVHALRLEKEAVARSIRYCREVLGIKKEGPE